MEDETKRLIAENYALNKENNEMLKKLIIFQKWNQIYKIVYWSIIILSAIGAFYFVKQYMGDIVSIYTGGMGTSNINSISDIKSTFGDKGQIEELIKSLKEN